MASYRNDIREEEIKNRLRKDFFSAYDAEQVIGDIDFAVAVPTESPTLFETEYLLWAEAKKGSSHDIYESLVQLILTIGKARIPQGPRRTHSPKGLRLQLSTEID